MEERPLSELLGELDALEQERRAWNKRYGSVLRSTREAVGLSQQALGSSLPEERTQSYVSQVESGTTGVSTPTMSNFREVLGSAATEGGPRADKGKADKPNPRQDAQEARKGKARKRN